MKGRKAAPIKGIDQHDFDKIAKASGVKASEKLRFLALAHVKDGKSFSEAARMIRVCPRTVIVWVQRFRKNGINGLKERYGGGPQPYLALDKHEEFRQSVLKLQTSRIGGRIRGEDVRELLETKYNICCSLSTVYNTLKRVGLVWITGRSKHLKGNEEAQIAFKKTFEVKSEKPSLPI